MLGRVRARRASLISEVLGLAPVLLFGLLTLITCKSGTTLLLPTALGFGSLLLRRICPLPCH
jgi:hypothetical protein